MAQIDGAAIAPAPGHDRSGKFTAGHSEYAAKRRRIAERVAALVQDYDAQSPTAMMLLRIAAEFLDTAERTRSHALRTRSTRASAKVLDRLERKPEPQPKPLDAYERERLAND